jgi:hypothetical protein
LTENIQFGKKQRRIGELIINNKISKTAESRIKIKTAPSTENIKKDHSKNFIEPFSSFSFKFSIFSTCKSIARGG